MARKGYGRNSTLVNITTHADDGTSPVGSNEWNENPKKDGIFGLTKSAQAISGNNNIVVTDSYIEITTADSASGGSNDGIYTLSAGTASLSATNYASDSASSISEGDLIYVVKAASQGTTTLKHQQGGAGAGKITTLTGVGKELSATVPTILMARTIGSVLEWVEYGGGAVADASITNTKLAVMAANTIKVRNANSSGAPSDIALATTQILIGNGTGFTAAALSGDVAMDNAGAVTVGTLNQNTTGSAATLTTPRAIGGVDFNGSAPINLPGVNAAGNQATSGLAATATLATTVTCTDNAANETVYPTFVDGATGAQDLETDTGLNYNPSTGLLSAVGLTLSGDLTVNGTNTILNTATLEVEDKDIFLAKVSSPSNTTANGAGIIIEAGSDTDKSILWDSTNSNFTSTEHVNIATGKKFKINNVDTLTATALGTNVVGSSLTSVGTLTGLTLTGALSGTDVALSGRLKTDKGADVASATAMTLGADGNAFDITGTTTIVTIPSTNWAAGNLIHLQFDGVLTVTHSSATDSILLGDQANMTTAAGDVLSLFFNGTNWVEVSRSSVASGGGATATHAYTNQSSTSYRGTGTSGTGIDVGVAIATEASGAGEREIYIRQIDANNEGVFTVIHKNGVTVEVQIA